MAHSPQPDKVVSTLLMRTKAELCQPTGVHVTVHKTGSLTHWYALTGICFVPGRHNPPGCGRRFQGLTAQFTRCFTFRAGLRFWYSFVGNSCSYNSYMPAMGNDGQAVQLFNHVKQLVKAFILPSRTEQLSLPFFFFIIILVVS